MTTLRTLVAGLCLYACACAPELPGSASHADADDLEIVSDAKADDFYSTTAREYVVEGRWRVVLEEDLADNALSTRRKRAEELIFLKQVAVAYFLTAYLVDKEARDPNGNYGGFSGLSKAGSYEDLNIRETSDPRVFTFTFRQVIAGPRNLLSRLPVRTNDDGETEFDLVVGEPTNEELARLEPNSEWFHEDPWKDFAPHRVPADRLTTIPVTIRPETELSDAWFDWQRLIEDDLLTIDVHFGWDYHSDYHRKHARSVFYWLRDEMGFEPPAQGFDALTHESGPFTRTLDAAGREVRVAIRLFYPKTGTANDPSTDAGGRQLERDFRASLAASDMIVFNGHAGPFYGFPLANWRTTDEGEIDYGELETVEMPADRYQVVMVDGCDTYQVAAGLARNPAKPDGDNLDVITTTTFADGELPYSTMNFLSHVLETDPDGRHRPRTLHSLLRDLRAATWNDALYGIHFVADNPRTHPYADPGSICAPCRTHADCGSTGNVCAKIGESRHCAPACTDPDACGRGATCAVIASASAQPIYDRACVPASLECP